MDPWNRADEATAEAADEAPGEAAAGDDRLPPTPSVVPGVDLDAVAADLAGVEAALERLDAGTYGTCAACGDPIDDATLAARPTAEACSAHLPSIAG